MDIEKIQFLVKLSSELFGVPVRAYQQGKRVAFSSFVPLEADPFILCEEQLHKNARNIDWIITSDYYYSILRGREFVLAIGPVGKRRISGRNNALEAASALGLEEEKVDLFIHEMDALVHLSLYQLTSMIRLLNFILNQEIIETSDLQLWALNPADFDFSIESVPRIEPEALLQKTILETKMPMEMLVERLIEGGRYNKLEHYITSFPDNFLLANFSVDKVNNARLSFAYRANQAQNCAISAGVNEARANLLRNQYIKAAEHLNSEEEILALRNEMLIDFARKIGNKEDFFRYRKTVIDAIDYINRHIAEPLDTTTISSQLFVSRSRLSTVFKQDTGLNLSDYIHQQKMEAAKRMLTSETRNLAGIASALGYKSQSHFTNVFKKYVGMTPSEYRRRNYHLE